MKSGMVLVVVVFFTGSVLAADFYPVAIAVGGGSDPVYIIDWAGDRYIKKFSPSGALLLEWGEEGAGEGQFDTPQGIALDNTGNVYVADTGNNRIQKFTAEGKFLKVWLVWGKDGELRDPVKLAIGPDLAVYVVSRLSNLLIKCSLEGEKLQEWWISEQEVVSPMDIACDINGNVYILDGPTNSRVFVFNPDGELQRIINAEGAFCLGANRELGGFFLFSLFHKRTINFLCPDGEIQNEWTVPADHGTALAVDGTGKVYLAAVHKAEGLPSWEWPISIQNYNLKGELIAQWGEPSRVSARGKLPVTWGAIKR